MGTNLVQLDEHPSLAPRRDRSDAQRSEVVKAFANCVFLRELPISIFCAGSLARREVGAKSDLDLFVTADDHPTLRSRLGSYSLFGELIRINSELGFTEFSNDGQYLKVYFIEDLKAFAGSPQDDSDNLFTTRMLMLLESEPVLHSDLYDAHLSDILHHYYRERRGKRSFRPLFLLNDLLRYWRTLCLNYEERRADTTLPWRKKNVNLKFSRMVTVFSTVLPLILRPIDNPAELANVCRQPPLRRLAIALEELDDAELTAAWPQVLDAYEDFLRWKEDDNIEQYLEGGVQKSAVREHATRISTFLHAALTNERIPAEFRRYLIL